MNFPENKTTNKIKILMVMLAGLANLMLVPITYADYTCETLNQPKELTGKIVTIAEEQIGKPGTDTVYTILNCFRETTCTLQSDKTSQCLPKITEKCSPNRTPGSEVYCQPVQAYLADSGAGILYAYIGNIYRWSAGMIGIVTVFYMVLGGIEVAASNGDSGKLEKAKERIMQSLAGLVLLFLSALLLYTINPTFFTK